MGLMVAWSWLVLGASVPLVGTVEDAAGRPIPQASVMLGDLNFLRETDELLGVTTTGADGAFRLDRDSRMAGRGTMWSPTLWVFAPGHRVAFVEFKRHIPTAAEPVRVVLQPSAGTPIRVLLPDGKPAAGAQVRPTRVNIQAPYPPTRFFDRLALTTDAGGRGVIDGLAPEDLAIVDVAMTGMTTQGVACGPASPEPKVITLRPEGRLVVRVTGTDPAAVAGWRITATSRPLNTGNSMVGSSSVAATTDAGGVADFPALPAGSIFWTIEAPAGSPFVAEDPLGVVISPGARTDVTIPLRPATRVVGTAIEAGTGRPLVGVRINTHCASANLSTADPATDAAGRFSYQTLAGANTYWIDHRSVPGTVFLLPDRPFQTEFRIPDGARDYTLAPIEFRPSAEVTGTVVDEAGRPAVGVDVQGNWHAVEAPNHPVQVATMTDEAGRFRLGGIAPGAKLSVSALIPDRAGSAVEQVMPVAPPGVTAPLSFLLHALPTFAVRGRVVGPDDRPVGGARVQILIKTPMMSQDGNAIRFSNPSEVISHPDGTFRTPAEVPEGSDYRVQAELWGFVSTLTGWIDKDTRGPVAVRLLRDRGSRAVAGQVRDTTGAPVAGVEVFQSGDGPAPTRSLTDAAGRFEVAGVSSGPALLFARSPAHRRTGVVVPPGSERVDLIVTRRDGPPPARLVAALPTDRPGDRAIALELVGDTWKLYLGGQQPAGYRPDPPAVLEMMARLEPDRITAMIENQVIPAEPRLLAALAAGRVANHPDQALELLAGVPTPELAARTYLDVFWTWNSVQPAAFSRDLLTRAEARAERVTDPVAKASLLISLAGAWARIGDRDHGIALARTANTLVGDKPDPMFQSNQYALVNVLALADLPAAIRRAEAAPAGYSQQRLWANLACQVAVTDPTEARRLLDRIDEKSARINAGDSVAVALAAAGKLAEAQAVAGEVGGDSTVRAVLPALAARKLASTQPDQARRWLAESFDQLATQAAMLHSEDQRVQEPGPLVAMALLLPVAVEVDPDGAREYLWLTLASRPPHPFGIERRPVMPWTRQYYVNLGSLANVVARYDRAAAEAVFAPVAERIPALNDYHWGLGSEAPALFRTAAAFDGATARAIWAVLAADPPAPQEGRFVANEPRHQTRADARLDIAHTLSLPPVLRANDALHASDLRRQSPWLDELLR